MTYEPGLGRYFFRTARELLHTRGRIAAIRFMRTNYDFSYPVAVKWLQEIADDKPWTFPFTKNEKEFRD